MTAESPRSPRRVIFFNRDVPYRLTESDRAQVLTACPDAAVFEASQGDTPDLAQVEILVTDLAVPPDLSAYPNLKWVQLVSAGANQIIDHPLARSDIPVTTASGLHGVPIAQFVTGTLLMLVHQLPQLASVQASRRWPNDRWSLRGSILRGATAGIIGYGSIGRECGRQLHALGMRIVALDASGKRDEGYNVWPDTGDPAGALPERWFAPEQLKEMLPLCDVVLVAVPFTPRTAGMIGPAELALTKQGSRFIIISRGGIVDERALADALTTGHLAGAVVDCYTQEPPPSEHFFYDTPNLIMTPHIAGAYEGFWPAMIQLFSENLGRYVQARPLLNQANKRLGY